MKAEDIHLYDWQRILFGEVPASFYLEVTIRTAVIYLVLMVSMRLMGKRMASQLGRVEMVSMVSLAAAIGVPIQSPDRGLLPVFIIAFIVIVTQQFIASKASKNEKFESITQDNIGILILDGCLNLKIMKRTRLTRERVFGQLRNLGVLHLGEISRLYLEANGSFTLIKLKEPKPGLCVLPDWDEDFQKRVCKRADETVCNHCGNRKNLPENTPEKCDRCGFEDWKDAVL